MTLWSLANGGCGGGRGRGVVCGVFKFHFVSFYFSFSGFSGAAGENLPGGGLKGGSIVTTKGGGGAWKGGGGAGRMSRITVLHGSTVSRQVPDAGSGDVALVWALWCSQFSVWDLVPLLRTL